MGRVRRILRDPLRVHRRFAWRPSRSLTNAFVLFLIEININITACDRGLRRGVRELCSQRLIEMKYFNGSRSLVRCLL